jgi:hypothetical protein
MSNRKANEELERLSHSNQSDAALVDVNENEKDLKPESATAVMMMSN